jgi:hypothetical protein
LHRARKFSSEKFQLPLGSKSIYPVFLRSFYLSVVHQFLCRHSDPETCLLEIQISFSDLLQIARRLEREKTSSLDNTECRNMQPLYPMPFSKLPALLCLNVCMHIIQGRS